MMFYRCPFCSKVAFYLFRKPEMYEPVVFAGAVTITNQQLDSLEHVRCGSCREILPTILREQIKEVIS